MPATNRAQLEPRQPTPPGNLGSNRSMGSAELAGSLNPKGCQRVAEGRQGFLGAATSGQRRRKSPAPRQGVSDSSPPCIATREEQHRLRTFQQELREPLEKHGVQYDPQYLR